MYPYTSLLVLALAASIVTPVLSAEAAAPLGKKEERAWSHLVKRGWQNKAFVTTCGLLATALLVDTIYAGEQQNGRLNVSRRKERSFGRGIPVDISEDRSILDITRRTSSHLELLNRADLGEALSLFGRMLDELD